MLGHRLDAFYALHVHSFLPFAQFCIFLHRSFDGWTASRTRRPQRERAQTNGLRIAQNVAKSVNQWPSLEVKIRGGNTGSNRLGRHVLLAFLNSV